MMPEEVTVREAANEDVESIVNVLTSTKLGSEKWKGNEKWVSTALQKSLAREDYLLLVAEFDSKIIGFIDCVVFPSYWECAKQGMINHLFVQAAYQGQGVGAKLISAIIERAGTENIGELHVSAERGNLEAQKFYEKYGFTEEQLLLERSQKANCVRTQIVALRIRERKMNKYRFLYSARHHLRFALLLQQQILVSTRRKS